MNTYSIKFSCARKPAPGAPAGSFVHRRGTLNCGAEELRLELVLGLAKQLYQVKETHMVMLAWTDEEGDQVLMSTELEFQEYLRFSRPTRTQLLKFSVHVGVDSNKLKGELTQQHPAISKYRTDQGSNDFRSPRDIFQFARCPVAAPKPLVLKEEAGGDGSLTQMPQELSREEYLRNVRPNYAQKHPVAAKFGTDLESKDFMPSRKAFQQPGPHPIFGDVVAKLPSEDSSNSTISPGSPYVRHASSAGSCPIVLKEGSESEEEDVVLTVNASDLRHIFHGAKTTPFSQTWTIINTDGKRDLKQLTMIYTGGKTNLRISGQPPTRDLSSFVQPIGDLNAGQKKTIKLNMVASGELDSEAIFRLQMPNGKFVGPELKVCTVVYMGPSKVRQDIPSVAPPLVKPQPAVISCIPDERADSVRKVQNVVPIVLPTTPPKLKFPVPASVQNTPQFPFPAEFAGTTATAAPVILTTTDHNLVRWASEIEVLVDMGFADMEENVRMLQKHVKVPSGAQSGQMSNISNSALNNMVEELMQKREDSERQEAEQEVARAEAVSAITSVPSTAAEYEEQEQNGVPIDVGADDDSCGDFDYVLGDDVY